MVGKCGKVCWGVREGEGRCNIGVGKYVRMWGKVGESTVIETHRLSAENFKITFTKGQLPPAILHYITLLVTW